MARQINNERIPEDLREEIQVAQNNIEAPVLESESEPEQGPTQDQTQNQGANQGQNQGQNLNPNDQDIFLGED